MKILKHTKVHTKVITHKELTLQTDEPLECALPRLRVRKLHMHKKEKGERIMKSRRYKKEKQRALYLCPFGSQFNVMVIKTQNRTEPEPERECHKKTIQYSTVTPK